jgi:hypothetical protein
LQLDQSSFEEAPLGVRMNEFEGFTLSHGRAAMSPGALAGLFIKGRHGHHQADREERANDERCVSRGIS